MLDNEKGLSLIFPNKNLEMHASDSKHLVVNDDFIEINVSGCVADSPSCVFGITKLTDYKSSKRKMNFLTLSPTLSDVPLAHCPNNLPFLESIIQNDESTVSAGPYFSLSPTGASSILLPIDDNEYAVLRSPGANQEYSYEILSNDTKSCDNERATCNSDYLQLPRYARTSSLHMPDHTLSEGICSEGITSRHVQRRSFSGRFNLEFTGLRRRARDDSRVSSRSTSPVPSLGCCGYDISKDGDSPIRERAASIFEGNGLFIRRDHPIFAYNFSRKVFVGGLPRDITIESIEAQFSCFGPLFVDWPNRENELIPPNGFAFLHFESTDGVERLFETVNTGKVRSKYTVSSQTVKSKEVEVKFWRMSDCEYIADDRSAISCASTVFVGALPRITTASELANFMDRMFSGVVYTTIDVDLVYGYPKGAGRVTFRTKASYNRALDFHYIDMDVGHNGKRKRIEIKPFMMTEQKCDLCLSHHGNQSNTKYCCRCSCSVCDSCEVGACCVNGGPHSLVGRQCDQGCSFDS